MGDYDYMKRHFEEIDEYMANVVREVVDAQPDDRRVVAIVDRVREEGYVKLADALNEVAR